MKLGKANIGLTLDDFDLELDLELESLELDELSSEDDSEHNEDGPSKVIADMLEVSEELDSNSGSTEFASTIRKREHTVLVVNIQHNLEAIFLVNLLRESVPCSNPKLTTQIELCVRAGTTLKPLGMLDFTFNNIISILNYNKEFQLSILMADSDVEVGLNMEQILCLP